MLKYHLRMENLELLKLKSELIYKKIIVLLAIAGGSLTYSVKFYEGGEYGVYYVYVAYWSYCCFCYRLFCG